VTRDIGNCSAVVSAAEGIPLDLYVMFDQSGSMSTPSGGGTRLDSVRAALTDFMQDDRSSGLGIGIGYFGYLPLGQTSCDAARYEKAAVPVGALPGNLGPMLQSLGAIVPVGETPTAAAIRGGCSYASSWKKAHPERLTVFLLITDGVPEAPVTSKQPGGCNPTLEDAVAATTACSSEDGGGLATYVVGVGPSLSNLDQIAKAGGTDHAYLVEGGDVGAQVLAALNAIRGEAQIPCELVIPPASGSESLDYGRVNVAFVDGAGTTHDLYKTLAADCGDDNGWYYDDESAPNTIRLCDRSCGLVKGDVKGHLDIALGCASIAVPR
jgi:hypothetical protein